MNTAADRKKKTVFVTGATGLLGTNLVRDLAGRGWGVRVLVRSAEKARCLLAGPDVEIVEGGMEGVGGFDGALEGCDVLFHGAAYFREYYAAGDHWAKLERVNVRGSIEILEAAERAGVGKAVYVCSCGVFGAPSEGGVIDESTPCDRESSHLCFRSKVLAEEAVLDRWRRSFGPSRRSPASRLPGSKTLTR